MESTLDQPRAREKDPRHRHRAKTDKRYIERETQWRVPERKKRDVKTNSAGGDCSEKSAKHIT